jgi:hypothetical protein
VTLSSSAWLRKEAKRGALWWRQLDRGGDRDEAATTGVFLMPPGLTGKKLEMREEL